MQGFNQILMQALAAEVANMTQSDAAHNTNVKLGRSDENVQVQKKNKY
jgi:hypothetical protein